MAHNKLTTREVLTTLGVLSPADARSITQPDGSLQTTAPLGARPFVLWAVIVSEVAVFRSVHDVMKAQVIDPDLTQATLDAVTAERGRWAMSFIKYTEPCGRWFLPSSAKLEAWPSDAKVRRVFEALCVEKGLKTEPEPDDVQADLFGPADAANTQP